MAAVAARLPGDAHALHMTGATATYLTIKGDAGGIVDVIINVSDGRTGHIELTTDGTIKRLSPPS